MYIVFILQHVCKTCLIYTKSKINMGNLVQFSMGNLQRYLRSTIVYCASLYTRHKVPVDLIGLVDILKQRFMRTHLYRQ